MAMCNPIFVSICLSQPQGYDVIREHANHLGLDYSGVSATKQLQASRPSLASGGNRPGLVVF
jgi:hypothetical protein